MSDRLPGYQEAVAAAAPHDGKASHEAVDILAQVDRLSWSPRRSSNSKRASQQPFQRRRGVNFAGSIISGAVGFQGGREGEMSDGERRPLFAFPMFRPSSASTRARSSCFNHVHDWRQIVNCGLMMFSHGEDCRPRRMLRKGPCPTKGACCCRTGGVGSQSKIRFHKLRQYTPACWAKWSEAYGR